MAIDQWLWTCPLTINCASGAQTTMAFKYEATVQHGEDTTEYVNLGKDGVSVAEIEGK